MSLLRSSVAASTARAYSSHQRRFIEFCQRFQCSPLPASEVTLLRFISESAARGLGSSSISANLAAVRHLHVISGLVSPLDGALRVTLATRALKRSSGAPRKRSPITFQLLERMGTLVNKREFDDLRFWAAATTAFFGFLRVSEFTVEGQFNPSIDLSLDDLTFSDGAAHIRLKTSKTDQLRVGVTIHVGATGGAVCPVSALREFVFARGPAPGPLFTDEWGLPPTRAWLTSRLDDVMSRLGIEGDFTSHSFRIGAATTAAANGIPDHLIKVMGRWSSDAYRTYIRTPVQRICSLSRSLVAR